MKARIIILSASALALLACSKTEVNPVESAPQEITFQTVETKVASSFDTEKKFYSYAYFLPSDKIVTTGSSWAANYASGEAYISASLTEYVTDESAWRNATTRYYWPKSGELTFFAWTDYTDAPSVTDCTIGCAKDKGINAAGYDITSNVNKDLLVADIAADQKENTVQYDGWKKGVPTVFRHVLSKLIFTVNTDYETSHDPYDGVTFKLKSITLKNVSTKGNYAQGSPTTSTAPWSNHSDAETLPAYSGTGIEVQKATATAQEVTPAAGDYTIVLPQDFAAVTTVTADTPVVEVVYTVTTEYVAGSPVTETVTRTKALKQIYTDNWVPGKKYTLNLILGLSEILWDPDVKDWEVGTGGEFNI